MIVACTNATCHAVHAVRYINAFRKSFKCGPLTYLLLHAGLIPPIKAFQAIKEPR